MLLIQLLAVAAMNKQQVINAVLPGPIMSQIQAVLQKDADADCIALVSREPLPESVYELEVAGYELRCVYCVSELAMREALVDHHMQKHEGQRLVLLSAFDAAVLAQDVLARLWRNEPQRISPWRSLQQIIRVRTVDPRLTRKPNRWMAEAILSGYETIQSRMVFGEVLDLEGAWRAIAMAHLKYTDVSVDLRSVLQWSARENVPVLLNSVPTELKNNLKVWLDSGLQETSGVVANILLSKDGSDLLPLALVCSLLYCSEADRLSSVGDIKLYQSRGVFTERHLGGVTFNNAVLKAFGDEATSLVSDWVGQKPYQVYSAVLAKAEQILASLDMSLAAQASDILPAGLLGRFSLFAKALDKVIDGAELTAAEAALKSISEHALSGLSLFKDSVERAQMAMRLGRWLSEKPKTSGTAAELIHHYVEDGGFCDWARAEIWAGDANEGLNEVYQRLSSAVRQVREQQNKSFGDELGVIARGDTLPEGFVFVEDALDRVVAPLAESGQVLLLVLDGMSEAVYRQLGEDLSHHNWLELKPHNQLESACLVAALPTITQVSRCSLLSGLLCEGNANDEKRAFSAHPALKRLASTKFTPTLFHKQDLSQPGSGSLHTDVRSVIAGTEHRILGVVINAIDDQLSSSAQVAVDWSFETIALLRQVMEAARESGRIIIMTSDHGHVLEHDSVYQLAAEGSGERYQVGGAGVELSPLEVKVSGSRVVTENNEAILPWSECLRYVRSKSHGYHGGGTLQEVVIPLGIFVNGSSEKQKIPSNWKGVPRAVPAWWHAKLLESNTVFEARDELGIKQEQKPARGKHASVSELTNDLFADLEPESVEIAVESNWIDNLVESALYQQVRERSRTAISDDEILALIRLMQRHQWQIMDATLSRELMIPKMRLRGFLSNAQRLLNLDGYSILSVDRESQTIRLNAQDLRKQFELG